MGRRTQVVALIRAVLKPKERSIRAILSVRSGLPKHISKACKHHGGLNLFTHCVEHRPQREEEVANLHRTTAVLNPLPVLRGTNHKVAAAAADPMENMAAPAGRKAHERLSLKDLFGLMDGVTEEQVTTRRGRRRRNLCRRIRSRGGWTRMWS